MKNCWFMILWICMGLTCAAVDKNSPNVILLLVDDLGYGDLGCTGNKLAKTPNIDAFAANGLTFSNGYAPAAQCSPTRASILSGQYPGRLHITTWISKPGGRYNSHRPEYKGIKIPRQRDELLLETVTLAERFKQKGYATINIGKWHIGGEGFAATDQGFDEQPGWREGASVKRWFAPFGMETLKDVDEGTYMTDALTDEAIRYIQAKKDEPFFMSFQYYTVHSPLKGKPEYVEAMKAQGAHEDKKQGYPNADFEAMKMSLDENVGRLLKAVERAGIADNTVIIFTSDNGGVLPYSRNVPYRYGKKHLEEGGIHVPFFILWPGLTKPGMVSDEPVSGLDLYATIVDAFKVDVSDGQVMDGESLLPLFSNPDEQLKREALYWHFPNLSIQGRQKIFPQGVVRERDFKLIMPYHPEEKPELYNMKADPTEQNNVANDHPERVERMIKMLRKHLKEIDAQMPQPNSLFKE